MIPKRISMCWNPPPNSNSGSLSSSAFIGEKFQAQTEVVLQVLGFFRFSMRQPFFICDAKIERGIRQRAKSEQLITRGKPVVVFWLKKVCPRQYVSEHCAVLFDSF